MASSHSISIFRFSHYCYTKVPVTENGVGDCSFYIRIISTGGVLISSIFIPGVTLIEILLRSFMPIELPNYGLKCTCLLKRPFYSMIWAREFEYTIVVAAVPVVVGCGECALAFDAYSSASRIFIFFCSSPMALYFSWFPRSFVIMWPISCDLLLGGSIL